MSINRYSPRPAAMAGRLGQHLLLSLGVATAAAVVATLPGLLSGAVPGHRSAYARDDRPVAPRLASLQEGKIVDRLDDAGSAGLAAIGGVTPAALAMPMSVSWPDSGEWSPIRYAVLEGQRSKAGEGATHAPSRRVALSPPRAAAGPLVILPAAAARAIETVAVTEASRDDSWSRYVVTPATKVADAVSGAAGNVQAAGSWGLSQATSLLPRW